MILIYLSALILLAILLYGIYCAWSLRHDGKYRIDKNLDGTYTLFYNYRGEWVMVICNVSYEVAMSIIWASADRKLRIPTTLI